MRSLLAALIESIYPPACAACDRLGREPFCQLCEDALLPAEPFAIRGATTSRAIFAYGGPIADAIHRLKYRNRPELARPLGTLLQAGLTSPTDGSRSGEALAPDSARSARCALRLPIDAVVPIPSTARRTIRRGYNHAHELARHLRLPIVPRALIRTVERPQVGLRRKERRENLVGAFRSGPESVRDCSLLLIDDVVTTGATATAAVRALLDAGARSVSVLALAREG